MKIVDDILLFLPFPIVLSISEDQERDGDMITKTTKKGENTI